jgi:hypothetical protein
MSADFLAAWEIYPDREGDNPKRKAYGCWKARIADGESVQAMLDGTKRYAEFSKAKGNVGTSFVMQATRFYGTDRAYRNPWTFVPPTIKPGAKGVNPEADRAWLHLRECIRNGKAPTDRHIAEAYRAIGGSRLMELSSQEIDKRESLFVSAWLAAKDRPDPRVASLVSSLVKKPE